MFLQETHSNSKVEQKWKKDFHGKVFFFHVKTNSCGVLTACFATNNSWRLYFNFLCLHQGLQIYSEKEQTEILSNLFALLKTFDIDPKTKHLITAGDFNLFFNSKLDAGYGKPTLKVFN